VGWGGGGGGERSGGVMVDVLLCVIGSELLPGNLLLGNWRLEYDATSFLSLPSFSFWET
jgi:hypothetical protein